MLRPKTPRATAAGRAHEPRPPRYTTEQALPDRTMENDRAAIHLAILAFKVVTNRRKKAEQSRKRAKTNVTIEGRPDFTGSQDNPLLEQASGRDYEDKMPTPGGPGGASSSASSEATKNIEQRANVPPIPYGAVPAVRLPLKSMFDGTGAWPKRDYAQPGATQYSWSNIGFPDNDSLIVKDFEQDTHIENSEPSVLALAQDIVNIKTKIAKDIADGRAVKTSIRHQRTIETFKLHGRTVAKVKFADADISRKGLAYSSLETSKALEKEISSKLGDQPSLEVEHLVAAHVLLRRAGDIGGKTEDYWKKARDLAQQQLYVLPELEAQVRGQITAGVALKDPLLAEMLDIVRKCLPNKGFNSYHQSQRDEFAYAQDLVHKLKDTEIIVVVDKANSLIAFQCSDAFRKLLTKSIEREVTEAFETYSTLQPVPIPDMTRHGLHWIDWLVNDHPELDFRNPKNDPKLAKSGVYHFGGRCAVGDPNGRKNPGWTKDSGSRLNDNQHVYKQLMKLRYSALGACTEVIRFFFEILEPDLLAEYQKVAKEVEKMGSIGFQTRRSADPFVIKALLVNLMTNEHKDKGDWHYGLAGLVPVGEFDGGDLLLRELGLSFEARSGCVQLIRGRELRHSITKYTGRRFVVVAVTHDAVRRWAQREAGENITDGSGPSGTSMLVIWHISCSPFNSPEKKKILIRRAGRDSCLDVGHEDIVPEEQTIEDEKDRIPERYLGLESSDDSGDESEASMVSTLPRRAGKPIKRSLDDSDGW